MQKFWSQVKEKGKNLFTKIKHSSRRTKILASIVVLLLLITLVGGTYALLTTSFEKKNTFTITTGTLTYELASSDLNENRQIEIPANGSVEIDLSITSLNDIDSTYLLYYEGGNASITAGYYNNGIYDGEADILAKDKQNVTVSFTNNSTSPVTITIGIQGGLYQKELVLAQGTQITSQVMGDAVITWKYVGEGEGPDHFPNKGEGYKITEVICNNGQGSWDNTNWTVVVNNIQGQGASCVISVDKQTEYQDQTGANIPELIEGLIPVTWNGSNWVKADIQSEWYNYDTQMWANAVTVTSASRSEYNSASPNTVISMDDIETMWVWIPRYSYTIGNTYGVQGYGGDTPSQATPGAIDIKFIDTNTKETGSATYSGSSPENWRTPDGFTFGTQELPGIWVAKFETSSTDQSASDGGGNTTSLDPLVKPDVISWRSINVSNAFTVSQKLTADGNRYGLDTNADGHMMKNSEWGVVAYLSQSKYGKYGNTDYSGTNKEVYINNYNSYRTGCSAGNPSANSSSSCQYTYSVEGSGTGASATGTIYGVYDMSGGANEYTMSNYNGTISKAGFSSLPDSKYYDRYTSSTASSACNGGVCYGHALSETEEWYNDDADTMVYSSNPWPHRGCSYSGVYTAGVFSFRDNNGNVVSSLSFRLALTPAP